MAHNIVIAAGSITDQALQFLRSHGAIVEQSLGLSIIELPEDAHIGYPGSQGIHNEYTVAWPEMNEEEGYEIEPTQWLAVYIELDSYRTRVELKKARGYRRRWC
jgi:hypothetical protein